MCFYIGIEDLAANALIEALQKSQKRFLTYHEIEMYGDKVIEILNEKSKAVLILSRENTTALFQNYSDFFMEKESEGGIGIELKPDKTLTDLIEFFRGYLPVDVLKAFISDESISTLGLDYGEQTL